MGLTGKFDFRKTLGGKIVLRIEEEVRPFWRRSNPDALRKRWRDAGLMDLAAPELRGLIDMRFKPYLQYLGSLGLVAASHEQHEPHGAVAAGAVPANGDARRVAH